MSATLRVGLVGLGVMGRSHARVLRSLDNVYFVGAVDPLGDPGGALLDEPAHETVEQLLALGVDACVVAAPTAFHEKIGLQLAEAGVHALVEKPLAADSPGARRLADAFAERDLVGCVGHIERFNPALRSLRARLEAGELGEIYQVATRRQGPFPNRISDVGVVKDLATHDIDLTSWVTGSAFRTVAARTAHRSGRQHEDLVAAVGTLDDGTITNHLVNWLSPMKERKTMVTGERGCFVADTVSADLTFYDNAAAVPSEWEAMSRFRGVSEGDVIRYALQKPEPLRIELEAFRDAALGRPADVVTMQQGVRTVRVAEAVLESAEEGRTVALEAEGARA